MSILHRGLFHNGTGCPKQFGQSLFPAGGGQHHRNTQRLGQGFAVNGKATANRLIHQIDTYNHPSAAFYNLQSQNQCPFQTSAVADHHNAAIRAFRDSLCSHLFIGTETGKRICTRQIGDLKSFPFPLRLSYRYGDGFSRPIARVLTHSGEGIEKGTLTHIGVSHQVYGILLYLRRFHYNRPVIRARSRLRSANTDPRKLIADTSARGLR